MKAYKNISVDIEFEAEVFPFEAASGLLTSTIEYLLFQRRQIPFVFPTFKYMTSKWSINEDNTYETFHLEKQRRLALSTLTEVNELCELVGALTGETTSIFTFTYKLLLNVSIVFQQHIHQESRSNAITGARIIFGATPFTPKEIYVINLPKASKKHSFNNHLKSVDITVHKVLMSLLTCEKLYQVFSTNIGTTNMYLDLATTSSGELTGGSDNFQIKEELDYSPSCSTIDINLIRNEPQQLNNYCCHDVTVFESIADLNLDETKGKLKSIDNQSGKTDVIWKEAKVFVKGFKDVFVKGRSIWED